MILESLTLVSTITLWRLCIWRRVSGLSELKTAESKAKERKFLILCDF